MTLIDNSTIMTSNSTINSTEWLLRSSIWSLRIVSPIFIILSPISNWACIQIFQSRIYIRSSSRWYFIFIAIFDTIYVLVTALLLFLLTLEIYILNWHVLLCKSIVFLNYLSCQISAGLLACLSIDRLIATSCISFYRQTCTTHFSRTVCLVVIILFSIINSHYLIGYTLDSGGYCNIRRYQFYEANYSRLNIVYLLSYSIIPFTIITICNFLIVLSVCQNKTNMKKKYEIKKPSLPLNISREQRTSCDKPKKILKFQECITENGTTNDCKYEMFTSIKNKKAMNNLLDSNFNWQSHRIDRLSEKLLFNVEEGTNSITIPSTLLETKSSPRERSLSTTLFSSSPTNSQKMCIQLQITISLLAISICFIFCTLPNCISTIMIQTYINDERVRQFWQAMNYFSIIPLLATHSVNLIFYYLSSKMFRERFNEYYFKKKT